MWRRLSHCDCRSDPLVAESDHGCGLVREAESEGLVSSLVGGVIDHRSFYLVKLGAVRENPFERAKVAQMWYLPICLDGYGAMNGVRRSVKLCEKAVGNVVEMEIAVLGGSCSHVEKRVAHFEAESSHACYISLWVETPFVLASMEEVNAVDGTVRRLFSQEVET